MRISMRRFTRLSNWFSKKVENLEHAVALYFMYYNFGRIHKDFAGNPGDGVRCGGSRLVAKRNCGLSRFKLRHYRSHTSIGKSAAGP